MGIRSHERTGGASTKLTSFRKPGTSVEIFSRLPKAQSAQQRVAVVSRSASIGQLLQFAGIPSSQNYVLGSFLSNVYRTKLGPPDFTRVLRDGAITGELPGGCDVQNSFARPCLL